MGDYHINIYFNNEENGYIADIPDLEGCRIMADTQEAAFAKIIAARDEWLQKAKQNGADLPIPRYQSHHDSPKQSFFAMSLTLDDYMSFLANEMLMPITTLRGYIDLIQRGVVGAVTEKQSEFLDIAAQNIEYLMQLVHDSRDVVRIENGTLKLDDVFVDMREVVESAIERCQPKIARHDQRVDFEVDTTIPETIGDRRRLEQVVTYLLARVVIYARPEQTVVIRLETRLESGELSIIGTIQPDHSTLDYITQDEADVRQQNDPLFVNRLPWSFDLPSYIAKSLVELHGGTLLVSSDDVAGSAFQFIIPVIDE